MENKKEFKRERRTVIDNCEEAVVEAPKIEEIEVFFLMDRFGYAKVIDKNTYERNKEAADSENRYVVKCKNTGKICPKTTAIPATCIDNSVYVLVTFNI